MTETTRNSDLEEMGVDEYAEAKKPKKEPKEEPKKEEVPEAEEKAE